MNRNARLAILLVLAILLSSCAVPLPQGEPYTVPVMLLSQNGLTVLGQNPVKVAVGEDASFDIALAAGFSVAESDSYTYSDGRLTVHDVRYPTTLAVGLDFDVTAWAGMDPANLPAGGEFSFSLGVTGGLYGEAEGSVEEGTYPVGTEIALTARPKEGGRFVCWSLGQKLANGGTPLAMTEQYTFRLGMDLRIYANFAKADTATVIYDANGGQTADGGGYLYRESDLSYYFFPRALANQGQLKRDGYVLYAYNTAPDGSGTEYTFGSNVVPEENGTKVLYAQWLPVDISVFSYIVKENEIHITGCYSEEEWVVLPEEIDGLPVTRVCSGALTGLKNMTTLVTTPALKQFETASVLDCPNFTALYLCDSIASIPDSFHADCPEFQTLKVGAVRDPVFCKTMVGSSAIKFQRLMMARDTDAIVLNSGSSSIYGFCSPLFDELMGHRYHIVNYGYDISLSIIFYLDVFEHFLGEGDILIHAPERGTQQLGGNLINEKLWSLFEGALEAFSYIDIRKYSRLFDSFTSFNTNRSKMQPLTYDDHYLYPDRWGDLNMDMPLNDEDYLEGEKPGMYFTFSPATADGKRLAAAYEQFRQCGASLYLSFAPCNRNAFVPSALTQAHHTNYEQMLERGLKITRISNLEDYILEGKYFYNSNYHPGTEGAKLRTRRLAADLLAQLEKEAAEAAAAP